MVCRENKARSVMIGLNKHYLRHDGWTDYTDNEFQSAFHDYGHRFEDAPAPSESQQRKLLEGLRAAIEQDPRISDADKYRPAKPNARTDNPGLITRIDQELTRLETGKHERTGKPLTNAQKMGGKQWASIQRLSAFIQRTQPAKDSYIEMNARHRGISVDDARTEWKKLVDVPPKARINDETGEALGQISLTDTYRDDLSIAGLTSEQQADVAQSAATRYAIQEMEKRRKSAIANLPSRPTVNESMTTTFTASGGQRIRCDQCGQFGHDAGSCPNGRAVAQIREAETKASQASARLTSIETKKDRLESEITKLQRKESRAKTDDEKTQAIEGIKNLRKQTRGLEATERRLIALRDYEEDNAAQCRNALIRSGPATSNLAESVAYNPATGYMKLMIRKASGTLSGHELRVSNQEFDDFMNADDHRAAAASSILRSRRKGGNDEWQYENPADRAAAREQHVCPTCGRWASLTSSHRCPVPGTKRAAEDTMNRADSTTTGGAYQAAAIRLGPGESRSLAGGLGVLQHAAARQVTEQIATDQTVSAMVNARYPDAAVTGSVTVWDDSDRGRALSTAPESGADIKCTCTEYKQRGVCKHIAETASTLTHIYGAEKVTDRTPRGKAVSFYSDDDNQAADSPDPGGLNRMNYNRIMNSRFSRAADVVVDSTIGRLNATKLLAATWPRDAAGNAITGEIPTHVKHTNPPSPRFKHTSVDIRRRTETQEAIRAGLRARTGKHWSVTHEGGVLRITASRKHRRQHGVITDDARTELARALDLPRSAVGVKGVTVPGEQSWHHEYVNRAFGQEPTVYGRKPVPRHSELSDHDRGI